MGRERIQNTASRRLLKGKERKGKERKRRKRAERREGHDKERLREFFVDLANPDVCVSDRLITTPRSGSGSDYYMNGE
jgi:hypothetical protein